MKRKELEEVLSLHKTWIRREKGGVIANLREADLGGADLRGADLRGANLIEADLGGADLRGADLRGANLIEADLGEANLRGADLIEADLRRANLRGADLGRANLKGADLRRANMPMYCKWAYSIISDKLQIGCETKTIEEWDSFFASNEIIETPRGTKDFLQIHAVYDACKAYLNRLNTKEI